MNRRRSSMFDIQGRDPRTRTGRSQIRTKQNLIISVQFGLNGSPGVHWSLIEGPRRQSSMEADSSLSFNSSTELFRLSSHLWFRFYLSRDLRTGSRRPKNWTLQRDSGARQPRKRYENNYQLGPNEKPVLSEFRKTIKEVLETTCEGIDYELVDQANLGNDRHNDRGDCDRDIWMIVIIFLFQWDR